MSFNDSLRSADTDDDMKSRSKFICSLPNIDSLNLPNFMHKYNGKPALIKKCGNIFSRGHYVEMDVNVYKFDLLCKTAWRAVSVRENR